jgi:hypothetical protein
MNLSNKVLDGVNIHIFIIPSDCERWKKDCVVGSAGIEIYHFENILMVVHEYSIDTIKEILKNYKTKDQLSFKCFICSEIFQRTKNRLTQDVSKKQDFIVCSRECQYKTKTFFSEQIDVKCSNCGLCFTKKPSAYKKAGIIFAHNHALPLITIKIKLTEAEDQNSKFI